MNVSLLHLHFIGGGHRQYLTSNCFADEMTKHTEESSDKLAISILKEWRSKNGENATVKRLLKVFEIARQNRHLNWETINALEDRIGN